MKISYDKDKCLACKSYELACSLAHSHFKDLETCLAKGELPYPKIFLSALIDWQPLINALAAGCALWFVHLVL